MKRNLLWHQCHNLQVSATAEEKILWHIAHKQHCGCRKMPRDIRKRMLKLGVVEQPLGFSVRLDRDFHPDTAHLAGNNPLP